MADWWIVTGANITLYNILPLLVFASDLKENDQLVAVH